MLRRWCLPLALVALTVGTALTATSASAAPADLTATSAPAAPTGLGDAGGFSPGGPIHLAEVSQDHASGIGNQEESKNWSGYAGTTGTYTSVSASWTQPAGTCSGGDQYAAFWVGLGGYSSSSRAEQTGSEVDCIGRTAQYYAWYEVYPSMSVNFSSTVKAGDHFNASVTYEGNNEFSLYIADTTEGWSHTTVQSLAGAARSSAEVIVEAPCCTSSGGILPLTDFGAISFTGSDANGAAIGDARGLTEIIMVDSAGGDKDSISAISAGTSFSATWLRSD
jgi:Peptidase A4 family